MADEKKPRPKYVTLHSRREEIREMFGREPNAFEERALAELPLTQDGKLKELNDITRQGSRIRELLQESERTRNVAMLNEAGELLFMQAYFMHSVKHPDDIEGGATEEERARFMVSSKSHPIRNLSCHEQTAMMAADGAKSVARGSLFPEISRPTSSYPANMGANRHATIEAEKAKFEAQVKPIPEQLVSRQSSLSRNPYAVDQTSSNLAPNPYALQRKASEAVSTMPQTTNTSNPEQLTSAVSQHTIGMPSMYAQSNYRNVPQRPQPLDLQLAPLDHLLSQHYTNMPTQDAAVPMNHGGWQQFQPQQNHLTTDPHAHSLSNRPADFKSLPVLPFHTSDVPANSYLNIRDAVPTGPFGQPGMNGYQSAGLHSAGAPSASSSISSGLATGHATLAPLGGPSNAQADSGSSHHVFYSSAVPSTSQPHPSIPTAAYPRARVPLPSGEVGQTSHPSDKHQSFGMESQDRMKPNMCGTSRSSGSAMLTSPSPHSSSAGGRKRDHDQFTEEVVEEVSKTSLPKKKAKKN